MRGRKFLFSRPDKKQYGTYIGKLFLNDGGVLLLHTKRNEKHCEYVKVVEKLEVVARTKKGKCYRDVVDVAVDNAKHVSFCENGSNHTICLTNYNLSPVLEKTVFEESDFSPFLNSNSEIVVRENTRLLEVFKVTKLVWKKDILSFFDEVVDIQKKRVFECYSFKGNGECTVKGNVQYASAKLTIDRPEFISNKNETGYRNVSISDQLVIAFVCLAVPMIFIDCFY